MDESRIPFLGTFVPVPSANPMVDPRADGEKSSSRCVRQLIRIGADNGWRISRLVSYYNHPAGVYRIRNWQTVRVLDTKSKYERMTHR